MQLGLSLTVASGGYSVVAVLRLLIAVASLVAWALVHAGSVAVTHGLSSTSSIIVMHVLVGCSPWGLEQLDTTV